MSQERIRSFIAVDLDEASIRERIVTAQRGLEQTRAQLKIVEPEIMHLTLRFLGEVPQTTVGKVEEAQKLNLASAGPRERDLALGIPTVGPLHPEQERVLAGGQGGRQHAPHRPPPRVARIRGRVDVAHEPVVNPEGKLPLIQIHR